MSADEDRSSCDRFTVSSRAVSGSVSVDEGRSSCDRFTTYKSGLSDVPTDESLSVTSVELPGVHGRRRRRSMPGVSGSCVQTRIGYPPCLSSSLYRAHLHAQQYTRGLRLAGILPSIPHCPTPPGSCSCLSPVDFADRLCLLRRVEDRQRGDRTSVYSHQHVVVDERVLSDVRPAVYAGVSPPSHRPLAVIRCPNSLFVYHDSLSLIVYHDSSSLIVYLCSNVITER